MSGIALLRRLLMKQAAKESAPYSGIMSIGTTVRKLVDKKVNRWIDSAKRQGQDIDKMGEQEIKYIVELNKPKGPMIGEHRVIDAASSEGQGITRDFFNMLDRQSGKNVIKTDFGGGITDDVSEIIIKIKTMKPMDSMKEANKVLKGEGRYKSLSQADRKKIVNDESVTDHIFERDIKPDPEDFAHGGRTGYKDAKLVEGPNKYSPKNFYALGIGPDLGKFMSEGVPRDEEGFHTTLNKEDLKYMWEVLQGEHPIKDIEDELMFRFGRVNPEKKSEFFAEIGKGKAGIGWKKKFAGGGRATSGLNYLLGEDDQNSRVPYGLGGGFNAARRAFLKIMGAGAAGTAAAKSGLFSLLKSGKPAIVKDLTSIPIKGGVDGMPAWFKPLVNKIIKEGDDVTKKFATQERQIVHQSTLPNSKTDVIVTQDLTSGNVLVDVGMGKHGFPDGHLGQPVRLEYKAAEEIEPILAKHMDPKNPKGEWLPNKGQKTKPEFNVEEAEFTGGHPENIKFEETTIEKFGQHGSNFDEVEKFATGKIKKKTAKESIKAERAHWTPEGDYASGGRVPLGLGGSATLKFLRRIFGKDRMIEMRSRDPEMYQGLLEIVPMFRSRNKKAMIDYMEKYLPHKSRPEIEEFILGADDDIIGNLIRLGSGRDYKAKIEMMKKLEKTNRLRDFDVTGRKPNASGGLAGMLGE